MKSNICKLTGEDSQLDAVLNEVDKCTAYNGLDPQSALRARLLAEEMVSMLPVITRYAEGIFWIENDENAYELHARLQAKSSVGFETREKLLSVSKSGKNASAVGIMNKIRVAAETFLFPSDDEVLLPDLVGFEVDPGTLSTRSWSLQLYIDQLSRQADGEHKSDAWDELEKSIIAKLADDVKVGILGKQVDIIICKKF